MGEKAVPILMCLYVLSTEDNAGDEFEWSFS